MERIALQLEPRQKSLVAALKRGESVEIVHQGRVLGVASPARPPAGSAEREQALADFCGMNAGAPGDTVEAKVRALRRGRNRRRNAP